MLNRIGSLLKLLMMHFSIAIMMKILQSILLIIVLPQQIHMEKKLQNCV